MVSTMRLRSKEGDGRGVSPGVTADASLLKRVYDPEEGTSPRRKRGGKYVRIEDGMGKEYPSVPEKTELFEQEGLPTMTDRSKKTAKSRCERTTRSAIMHTTSFYVTCLGSIWCSSIR